MTAKPVRITLSRTAGFRLQEHSLALNGLPATKVDRSGDGKWGNPWRVTRDKPSGHWFVEGPRLSFPILCGNKGGAALKAIDIFRKHHAPRLPVAELRGKNLACWCKPGEPCHADVLLELANG